MSLGLHFACSDDLMGLSAFTPLYCRKNVVILRSIGGRLQYVSSLKPAEIVWKVSVQCADSVKGY